MARAKQFSHRLQTFLGPFESAVVSYLEKELSYGKAEVVRRAVSYMAAAVMDGEAQKAKFEEFVRKEFRKTLDDAELGKVLDKTMSQFISGTLVQNKAALGEFEMGKPSEVDMAKAFDI